jgi:hypothetical protein
LIALISSKNNENENMNKILAISSQILENYNKIPLHSSQNFEWAKNCALIYTDYQENKFDFLNLIDLLKNAL